MPMTILTDMAGWSVETINSIPKHLVAIDLQGKRRPMKRYDGLHYLSYKDFVACMNDVYKRVDVVGQVTKELLMSSLDEQQAPSDSGLHTEEVGMPEVETQKACTIQVPKELEDFVLPQDPSSINRTRVALADLSHRDGDPQEDYGLDRHARKVIQQVC
eukprot:3980211-Amphidinium_carterae.1